MQDEWQRYRSLQGRPASFVPARMTIVQAAEVLSLCCSLCRDLHEKTASYVLLRRHVRGEVLLFSLFVRQTTVAA